MPDLIMHFKHLGNMFQCKETTQTFIGQSRFWKLSVFMIFSEHVLDKTIGTMVCWLIEDASTCNY